MLICCVLSPLQNKTLSEKKTKNNREATTVTLTQASQALQTNIWIELYESISIVCRPKETLDFKRTYLYMLVYGP